MMNNDNSKQHRFSIVKPAILITLIMVVLCGLVYPLLVTGLSQALINDKADGSIIYVDGKPVGSEIVGQLFTEEYFFHSRPSAVNYNTVEKGEELAIASGANNYGASNPLLIERVESELDTILSENPGVEKKDIPIDMITQSGSGLDPHISIENARLQASRIASSSGLDPAVVDEIIERNTEGKTLGFLGSSKLNVLKANLDIAVELGIIDSFEI